MILSIDVGGTKGSFALVDSSYTLSSRQILKTSEFSTFDEMIDSYLQSHTGNSILGVCLGVAGTVKNNSASLTNLSWEINANNLKKKFSFKNIWVLNDLEAYAWGIEILKTNGLKILQKGQKFDSHCSLIAAGTGLGEANLFNYKGKLIPSPSEGSHAEFAPTVDDLDFLKWLYCKYDHVSWERVVSGMFGFENIYNFLIESGQEQKIEGLDKQIPNLGAVISKRAGEGNKTAVSVINKFCYYYGAEAGNLALKTLAKGGIYVGGGIVGKILPWIEKGQFLEGFTKKGRFSSLMKDIPVKIIVDNDCALKGAGRFGLLNLNS